MSAHASALLLLLGMVLCVGPGQVLAGSSSHYFEQMQGAEPTDGRLLARVQVCRGRETIQAIILNSTLHIHICMIDSLYRSVITATHEDT